MPLSLSSITPSFAANYILATLSASDLKRFSPQLTPCLLHTGQVLYEKGDEVKEVYFAKAGMISLVLGSRLGVEVEVGVVGREGALGALDALGHNPSPTRANVQIAGSGWRISAQALRLECARNSTLQQAILRAAYSLNQQTSQCVLCNRLHHVEQRLARWLLMCADRAGTPCLELTHEIIANMLGVRRVGVTLAAGVLREAGLIEYARGEIRILDRPSLEAHACECYGAIRSSFCSLEPEELSRNGSSNGSR